MAKAAEVQKALEELQRAVEARIAALEDENRTLRARFHVTGKKFAEMVERHFTPGEATPGRIQMLFDDLAYNGMDVDDVVPDLASYGPEAAVIERRARELLEEASAENDEETARLSAEAGQLRRQEGRTAGILLALTAPPATPAPEFNPIPDLMDF